MKVKNNSSRPYNLNLRVKNAGVVRLTLIPGFNDIDKDHEKLLESNSYVKELVKGGDLEIVKMRGSKKTEPTPKESPNGNDVF